MPSIKPMLASKADLSKVVYPVMASPKLDGIRCLSMEDGPKSRKLKPIPNRHIRKVLKDMRINGMDGELMVHGAEDFNAVQSGVMSGDGEPDFYYNVFDCFQDASGKDISQASFVMRLAFARHRVAKLGWPLKLVPHFVIDNEEALLELLDQWIDEGYEGAMIRNPNGRYKYGRSTVNEGILLKVKKFFDDEGVLVEIIEKMHNGNPAETDELGHTKRSSAKANLKPAGTAGALVLHWNDLEFKVGFGPGINDAIKQDWWDHREGLLGKSMKFRYQEVSKDGVPRFGKALGFRHGDDT